MALMSKGSNAEFALFRSKDGLKYLVRGTEAGVDLPGDVARLIAHSETGTQLISSGFDDKYLRSIKQAWSILINEDGGTVRFNKAPEYPQPSSLAEALEWAKAWLAEHD